LPRALLALAIGAFGIGTAEFVVMGMLPQIADGLDVSVSAVGLLISAYAIGVVIGAPTLTALGVRFTPRQMLVALMVLFTVGNVLSALAPSYGALVAARVFAALAHGAFFGVGAVAARRLVPREKATQAISLMITGLTLANVVGVPLGTFVA
jgi:MFS transporter, DHA1 family, inner membrane transport protein